MIIKGMKRSKSTQVQPEGLEDKFLSFINKANSNLDSTTKKIIVNTPFSSQSSGTRCQFIPGICTSQIFKHCAQFDLSFYNVFFL